jgi:hypothetical protein
MKGECQVEVEQVAICAHIGWGAVEGGSSVQIQLQAVQAQVTFTSERTTIRCGAVGKGGYSRPAI